MASVRRENHAEYDVERIGQRYNKTDAASVKNVVSEYKRMKGVEPSSPAWKAGVIAVIRHPQKYDATIPKNA